jgi:hypothetical protein
MEIDSAAFANIATDFGKIVLALDDMGVRLADGFGDNVPEITPENVWFNGLSKCGHRKNSEVSIPWPSDKATGGVGSSVTAVSGHWFAGSLLDKRCCNGDCSYETMNFPRVMPKERYMQAGTEPRNLGLWFACCKTAYRPYDVAVTAFLIIAKHQLRTKIAVASDGVDCNWEDGRQLCQQILDYGAPYHIDAEGDLQYV